MRKHFFSSPSPACLCALCVLCGNFFLFSQTPKQWAKLGDEALAEGDHFGAAHYYKSALSFDSVNTEVIFKYAESLRKSNNYELAEYYYQKICNAGEDQPAAGRDLCLFWLASMQKFNGNYDNAKDNFRKFEKTYRDKSSYYSKKAKQEIKSCEFAKKLLLDSIPVRIKNAGDSLNSFDAELGAMLARDSSMLFSSLRSANGNYNDKNYKMKIYKAEKRGDRWVAGSALDTAINNSGFHTANGTFGKDEKRFYFSRCSGEYKCAIYRSELKNGKWQTAVKMENGINAENYTSTQPMLSEMEGQEILFFVSDMPGGKGKLDIWTINISELSKGKSSVKPLPLGKINTLDNDISPFYDAKNNTLYFSSEWYYGLGGQDIFKASHSGKNFSSPENLGFPFNTSVNDMYFSYYPQINSGFLTSNRRGSYTKEGETCCNDIYVYDYPKAEISDTLQSDTLMVEEKKYTSLEMLNKYLPVTLYFHNDEPNPKSRDTATQLNYLKTYADYTAMMETYKEEYSKGLSGDAKEKAKEDIEMFFTAYVEKGVNDLELFSELLLKELEKGAKIELTVKGYASPLAKTDYNVNLTLRRISSLQNYLSETMDGAYIPYLRKTSVNGGALEVMKIPFGEYKADTAVSDNLNDQRNSVFSRKAALERKIEIISVSQANADSIFPVLTFEQEIFDFGTTEAGEILTHTFSFENTGKENLLIKNVSSSCGCTAAKWTRNELAPGEKGEIEISFDTARQRGKQTKTVTIETNAVPAVKVIHVVAEVGEK